LPRRTVILAEDETDLLLFPPLRSAWGKRGQPTTVPLSGWNARRVVYGMINIRTGSRLFLAHCSHEQEAFHSFLELLHDHYRGWQIALLLDENSGHTAKDSQQLAGQFGVNLLWLPNRSPELNPMDHLWGKAKDYICANTQRHTIDEQVTRFIKYLQILTPHQAMDQAGILSPHFWLKDLL
jgi:hypothetical protein